MNLFYRTLAQRLADFAGPLTEQLKLLNLIYSVDKDIEEVKGIAEHAVTPEELREQVMTKGELEEMGDFPSLPTGTLLHSMFAKTDVDEITPVAGQVNGDVSGTVGPSEGHYPVYGDGGNLVMGTSTPGGPSGYRPYFGVNYAALVSQTHNRIALRLDNTPAGEWLGSYTVASPTSISQKTLRRVEPYDSGVPEEDRIPAYGAGGRLRAGDADVTFSSPAAPDNPNDVVNVGTLNSQIYTAGFMGSIGAVNGHRYVPGFSIHAGGASPTAYRIGQYPLGSAAPDLENNLILQTGANGRLTVGDADTTVDSEGNLNRPYDAVNMGTMSAVVPGTLNLGGTNHNLKYFGVVEATIPTIEPNTSYYMALTDLGGTLVGSGLTRAKVFGPSDEPLGQTLAMYDNNGRLNVADPFPANSDTYHAVNMRKLNSRLSHPQRVAIDALDPNTATVADIVNALQAS